MRVQADPVGVKTRLVGRLRVGCRVLADRYRVVRTLAPQVEEAAVGVAQGVVAPARDVDAVETAPACAVATQRDAVAAVGQQLSGLQCRLARHHRGARGICQRRAVVAHGRGWRLQQARDFARHAFLQQRCYRRQTRVAHAPAPWRAVQQHIGQRDDGHALVVGHHGVDRRAAAAAGLALGGEVDRFDETHRAARMQGLQPAQVGHSGAGLEHRRQRAGVGRHHQFVGRGTAQCQSRHALRRVLVGQGVVAGGIGRLGHAPRQALGLRVVPLLMHRCPRRAGQRAGIGLIQHQGRHQVLEHRA